MSELMTTKEVAKYLKLHEVTICKFAKVGQIPCIRIGRVFRFRKEAIDAWLGGMRAPASPGPNELQAKYAEKDESEDDI